jgi:hypothetical protein
MVASTPSVDRASEIKVRQLLRRLPGERQIANARKIAALRKPANDLRRLLKRDYVRSLRRGLGYGEVRRVLATFAHIFPAFNSRSVGIMPTKNFGTIAAKLGFTVKAVPFGGSEGLALRGFYAQRSAGVLKDPLIFVNTAHPPVVALTSFVHEIGHHVSREILRLKPSRTHFYFDAGYADQLTEPSELVADVVVSIAGYPEKVARKIFATPWDWGLVARASRLSDNAFAEVQRHLKEAYGFDLYLEHVPAEQRLQYLGGIIHYAKLRWALLAEYDL